MRNMQCSGRCSYYLHTLYRSAESNEFVLVKHKRKLEYIYFDSVRPILIFRLLQSIEMNNILCYDINIDLSNIPDNLIQGNKNKILRR